MDGNARFYVAVLFSFSCSLFLPSALGSLSSTPVTLSTTLGDVIGVRKSAGAGAPMVEVFYGIPFARPPVGSLRFRAPEPAQPWGSTPLDGTVQPNACWQTIDTSFDQFDGVDMWNPNTDRSEDCLYLNVWRPDSTSSSSIPGSGDGEGSSASASHKTILVWIFGGGFFSGSATLDVYEASQLAVRNDVIVVSIAYRTGPLGYLYLGEAGVPGNAGMLDQVMALQWVKDNAALLGGSPDDITIFGESAGAASVGFHLFSPLSRDLFNRAIMQSASALANWAIMDTSKARDRSLELAKLVQCPHTTEAAALACLMTADPETLSVQQWYLNMPKYFDATFSPVVDGTFLLNHPAVDLRNGDVKLTDVILGVNKDEGVYFAVYAFMDRLPLDGGGRLSEHDFQHILYRVSGHNSTFKNELFGLYSNGESTRPIDIVDDVTGDELFKCPVVDFAREYTRVGGRAYMYSFEEDFSSNPWPNWMGVPHGYEIEVVFGRPLAPTANNTETEKELSVQVMQMWTDFAKNGDPNDDTEGTDAAQWPLYTLESEEYVTIDAAGLHTKQRLRVQECELWARSGQANGAVVPAVAATEAPSSVNEVEVALTDDDNNNAGTGSPDGAVVQAVQDPTSAATAATAEQTASSVVVPMPESEQGPSQSQHEYAVPNPDSNSNSNININLPATMVRDANINTRDIVVAEVIAL